MIEYDKMREVIVSGLSTYIGCPVIRQNHDGEQPEYPFVSYTITTLMSQNNGAYGVYDDGIDRKPITQIWSISSHSRNNSESVTLICKVREWFDRVGTQYLNDNNVIVQSIGSITNRDNLITIGYEYRNGFDIDFWLFDEVNNPITDENTIETIDIKQSEYK